MRSERITPQKAADMLKHNTSNRKVNARLVERYAGAMKRGEWKLTHEGIAFNCDGSLVDGQHRLMACIQANVPFDCYVFRQIDKEAFRVINSGKGRSAVDVLGMLGTDYACNTAAAARAVYSFLDERGFPTARRDVLTSTQVVALVDQYVGLNECVHEIREAGVEKIVAPGIAAGLRWVLGQKHPRIAEDFFHKIGQGEELTRGDPEWLIRKKMLEMRSVRNKPYPDVQAALLIRAWNAKKAKVKMASLRWGAAEAFPKISL